MISVFCDSDMNVTSHEDFSTCVSHGPYYFRTFDNMEFLSGGFCSYILFSDGLHSVHMKMHHCHHFETCAKVVTLLNKTRKHCCSY